jgi:Raf kinase inhibitor-like protein, YbhB/YbcL family
MSKYLKIILLLFLITVTIIFGVLFLKNKNSSLEPIKKIAINNSNNMIISSPAFLEGNKIPDSYGCHGQDVNPPLKFSGVPTEAKSLVLLVDDPDAPSGDWVHWLVFNINPQTESVDENSVPNGAVVGINSFGDKKYGGPCPPMGTHHYKFKLYALDEVLTLADSTEKSELIKAMNNHVIASSVLTGTYSR